MYMHTFETVACLRLNAPRLWDSVEGRGYCSEMSVTCPHACLLPQIPWSAVAAVDCTTKQSPEMFTLFFATARDCQINKVRVRIPKPHLDANGLVASLSGVWPCCCVCGVCTSGVSTRVQRSA